MNKTMSLSIDFPINVGNDILLNELDASMSESLFHLVDRNRSHLREFLGWLDHNTSLDDSLKFIETELTKHQSLEGLTLGIYVDKNLVGLVSLYGIDRINHCTSIGYWISQDMQGKGIMSRSVRKLIDLAFNHLNLHRIEIRCAVKNYKSQKVAEQLGFKREGVLKESIFHYGNYFDAYLYGLIKTRV